MCYCKEINKMKKGRKRKEKFKLPKCSVTQSGAFYSLKIIQWTNDFFLFFFFLPLEIIITIVNKVLGILMDKSWCFRSSFQLIYTSYFAMFTVEMIKGTTQSIPQTLKERNDLPQQMKYLLESHASAFQWLPRKSNNRMSRNIGGTRLC